MSDDIPTTAIEDVVVRRRSDDPRRSHDALSLADNHGETGHYSMPRSMPVIDRPASIPTETQITTAPETEVKTNRRLNTDSEQSGSRDDALASANQNYSTRGYTSLPAPRTEGVQDSPLETGGPLPTTTNVVGTDIRWDASQIKDVFVENSSTLEHSRPDNGGEDDDNYDIIGNAALPLSARTASEQARVAGYRPVAKAKPPILPKPNVLKINLALMQTPIDPPMRENGYIVEIRDTGKREIISEDGKADRNATSNRPESQTQSQSNFDALSPVRQRHENKMKSFSVQKTLAGSHKTNLSSVHNQTHTSLYEDTATYQEPQFPTYDTNEKISRIEPRSIQDNDNDVLTENDANNVNDIESPLPDTDKIRAYEHLSTVKDPPPRALKDSNDIFPSNTKYANTSNLTGTHALSKPGSGVGGNEKKPDHISSSFGVESTDDNGLNTKNSSEDVDWLKQLRLVKDSNGAKPKMSSPVQPDRDIELTNSMPKKNPKTNVLGGTNSLDKGHVYKPHDFSHDENKHSALTTMVIMLSGVFCTFGICIAMAATMIQMLHESAAEIFFVRSYYAACFSIAIVLQFALYSYSGITSSTKKGKSARQSLPEINARRVACFMSFIFTSINLGVLLSMGLKSRWQQRDGSLANVCEEASNSFIANIVIMFVFNFTLLVSVFSNTKLLAYPAAVSKTILMGFMYLIGISGSAWSLAAMNIGRVMLQSSFVSNRSTENVTNTEAACFQLFTSMPGTQPLVESLALLFTQFYIEIFYVGLLLLARYTQFGPTLGLKHEPPDTKSLNLIRAVRNKINKKTPATTTANNTNNPSIITENLNGIHDTVMGYTNNIHATETTLTNNNRNLQTNNAMSSVSENIGDSESFAPLTKINSTKICAVGTALHRRPEFIISVLTAVGGICSVFTITSKFWTWAAAYSTSRAWFLVELYSFGINVLALVVSTILCFGSYREWTRRNLSQSKRISTSITPIVHPTYSVNDDTGEKYHQRTNSFQHGLVNRSPINKEGMTSVDVQHEHRINPADIVIIALSCPLALGYIIFYEFAVIRTAIHDANAILGVDAAIVELLQIVAQTAVMLMVLRRPSILSEVPNPRTDISGAKTRSPWIRLKTWCCMALVVYNFIQTNLATMRQDSRVYGAIFRYAFGVGADIFLRAYVHGFYAFYRMHSLSVFMEAFVSSLK